MLIPPKEGRTLEVEQGRVLRITDVEGGQCGDMVVLNLHDTKERYCAWLSQQLAGELIKIRTLYSNPPFSRPLMTIEDDLVGVHWPGAARCNRAFLAKIASTEKFGCQEILEKILAPYQVQPHEVPDVFNVFMRMDIYDGGRREIGPMPAKKGDYADFRAHMDCLVGISACPTLSGKPFLMQVLDTQPDRS